MKNLKLFPKMFLQIFAILSVLILAIHLFVFFAFPKSYLASRQEEIVSQADQIADQLEGQDLDYVQASLDFYSKTNDIRASLKEGGGENELAIQDGVGVDLTSENNSLIIEERPLDLADGGKRTLQFVSTADMQREARDLSLQFLPYSLALSLLVSILLALLYAQVTKRQIQEIKDTTDRMMDLDRAAWFKVDSSNEVGQLKDQINDLYRSLLQTIDDLEDKNEEIIKLENLRYDFFRGTSHELKTPLASLKVVLENMQYNIGKYKDRDKYIGKSIALVDDLTQHISRLLSISSLDHMKDDEERLIIHSVLQEVLAKYDLLAKQKQISIVNDLEDQTMVIGRPALKIILSNLISNAIKYSPSQGQVFIGVAGGNFYVANSSPDPSRLDLDRAFEINFSLDLDTSNGLGLYIVSNLLSNYGFNYQLTQENGQVIFKIEL